MNLGVRLTAWREYAGYTQSKLASILGLTRSAVWQWEEGRTNPGSKHVAAAVDAFGISMERFYGPLPRAKTRKGRAA